MSLTAVPPVVVPLWPVQSGGGWGLVGPLVVVIAAVCSVAILAYETPYPGRWMARARRRLLFGLPVGTLLTAFAIVVVYLFLQGGIHHWRDPLVLPFRSWSYRYPLGMLTAAFTHSGFGHVSSNLTAWLAFGGIVEYVWGHYPRDRGSTAFRSWDRLRSREALASIAGTPYGRALAVPVAAFLVGLFTALFSLGPIVGFSGVVFAAAGVALVHRPITAAVAVLGGRALQLGLQTLLFPEFVSSASPRVVTPGWADIAIQGHAIGLFAGVAIGVWLAARREEWPDRGRVWIALLLFGVAEGLWAVYVPIDGNRFVLYRWLGVALVLLTATLLVAGPLDRRHRPFFRGGDVSVAMLIVAGLLGGLLLSGVVYNVAPVGQTGPPGETVSVRDYEVGYGENVENQYVGAVDVPFLPDPTTVNTSGVIVSSQKRTMWTVVVPAGRLANRGRARFPLGGVSWRTDVSVYRQSWRVVGNASVYRVFLRPDTTDNWTLVHRSEATTADVSLEGRSISMVPTEDGFQFAVNRDGGGRRLGSIPASDERTRVGGIVFERQNRTIYALSGSAGERTRVPVARRAS